MVSIPHKQPGTMQLAVQLGRLYLLATTFGLLINRGREMPFGWPVGLFVMFELRGVNSEN